MHSPVLFLLVATLLPLAGAVTLLFIGRRMDSPLAGWMGTIFSASSFGITLAAMVRWYEGKQGVENWGMDVRSIVRTLALLPAGSQFRGHHPGLLDPGIYVDSLTIAMFAMVALVGGIIHIYSIGSQRRDPRHPQFFAVLGFATFAMLALILSGTMVQIGACWLLITLSTWLLTRTGKRNAGAPRAARKALAFNAVGDLALLAAGTFIVARIGNLALPSLWTVLAGAASGSDVKLAGGGVLSSTTMTLTGIAFFLAAAARSALFPFQTWLADAAARAPAPAGALLAATATGVAGIYLLGRLFPILTPDARLFIAILGVTTIVMAALISTAQTDLRRALAWLAASQLGYCALAIGVGSWAGGMFGMMTHGFILSLLFLAAGSVAASTSGAKDLTRLGGLWRRLPVTAAIFAVAAMALAGIPGLSGAYGRSVILTDAAAFADFAISAGHRSRAYGLLFILPTAAIAVTAFQLARLWMLTFAGKPRDSALIVAARERAGLWAPMLALLVPVIIAGFAMNIPELLGSSIVESRTLCEELSQKIGPAAAGKAMPFEQAWPAPRGAAPEPGPLETIEASPPDTSPAGLSHERGAILQHKWLTAAWIAGLALGLAFHWNGTALADRLVRHRPFNWIRAWLRDGMFFDELYYWTVGRLAISIGGIFVSFDRIVLQGLFRRGFRRIGRLWLSLQQRFARFS